MANNFWQSGLEPKRSHRWFLQFGANAAGGLNEISFACKKVDKPSFKINEVVHQYLNHKFYYPGRLEWNPITVTLANINDGNIDASRIVHLITADAGYIFPLKPAYQATGTNDFSSSTLSKAKFKELIGQVSIAQINSEGTVIERWELNNPIFTDIKFSSGLNYEQEDIVEMSFGIDYDWAEFTPGTTDMTA